MPEFAFEVWPIACPPLELSRRKLSLPWIGTVSGETQSVLAPLVSLLMPLLSALPGQSIYKQPPNGLPDHSCPIHWIHFAASTGAAPRYMLGIRSSDTGFVIGVGILGSDGYSCAAQ